MENKFIYCFNEEEYKRLLSQGFSYICNCNMGKNKAYVFENNCKSLNFSENDKKQILFTNKMYF